MDDTEGLNAFLEVSKSYYIGPKNLDIGGDPFLNRLICDVLDISNVVYNPLIPKYNVLSDRKYHTVTSFSVLNILVKKVGGQYVFDKKAARCHIELCIWSLIPYGGRIYIKVFEGDRRGVCGKTPQYIYAQTNMNWLQYQPVLAEICEENGCELYVEHVMRGYVIRNS